MALTVRTDDEFEQALDELTASLGDSRQEIIRRAVLELRDRALHRARIEGATDRLLANWTELLDRLAST